MKKSRCLITAVLSAATLSSISLTAGAAVIPLTNNSFETSQSISGGSIPGWNGTGFEESPGFPSPLPSPASGDSYVTLGAYGQNLSLTQTTSSTVTSAGEVLTLSVADGHRNDGYAFNPNVLLEFILGSTTIDETSSAATFTAPTDPGSGEFSLATLQYTTTTADIGQSIEVGIGSANSARVSLDNVNLTDSLSTPEPTTASLLGLGVLLAMSARLLCRQKSS